MARVQLEPVDILEFIIKNETDPSMQRVVEFTFDEVYGRLFAAEKADPDYILGGRFSRSVSIMVRNAAQGTDPRGRDIDIDETMEKIEKACQDLSFLLKSHAVPGFHASAFQGNLTARHTTPNASYFYSFKPGTPAGGYDASTPDATILTNARKQAVKLINKSVK